MTRNAVKRKSSQCVQMSDRASDCQCVRCRSLTVLRQSQFSGLRLRLGESNTNSHTNGLFGQAGNNTDVQLMPVKRICEVSEQTMSYTIVCDCQRG